MLHPLQPEFIVYVTMCFRQLGTQKFVHQVWCHWIVDCVEPFIACNPWKYGCRDLRSSQNVL